MWWTLGENLRDSHKVFQRHYTACHTGNNSADTAAFTQSVIFILSDFAGIGTGPAPREAWHQALRGLMLTLSGIKSGVYGIIAEPRTGRAWGPDQRQEEQNITHSGNLCWSCVEESGVGMVINADWKTVKLDHEIYMVATAELDWKMTYMVVTAELYIDLQTIEAWPRNIHGHHYWTTNWKTVEAWPGKKLEGN